jgi:acetyl esterase/lipase
MINRFAFGRSLLTFAALLWIASAAASAAEPVVEENLVYGKGGGKDLVLDLARPERASGAGPGLVFIHGGGWTGGSRQMYEKEIREAAKRGYVAVTISYRLTDPDANGKPANPFPAQIEDAKCAVRWLRANAEKYHVDPNRIGVVGASAGGHLSLLVGVTDESQKLEGSGGNNGVSSRVQAVVNYFGPTDLGHLFSTSQRASKPLSNLIGGPPEKHAQAYALASPITHVTKDDPPTLTLHGDVDQVVTPDQASLFDAAMKRAGAPHTLMMLEGQGHGFKGAAAAKARAAMYAFFDEHLKKKSR